MFILIFILFFFFFLLIFNLHFQRRNGLFPVGRLLLKKYFSDCSETMIFCQHIGIWQLLTIQFYLGAVAINLLGNSPLCTGGFLGYLILDVAVLERGGKRRLKQNNWTVCLKLLACIHVVYFYHV